MQSAIFQKFSPPQKWRPFWIFEFLPKMAKHKFASISLTMRDRAISSKFSTHWVSDHCTLCNFGKKIWKSPKMAAIFGDFRKFFAKNCKYCKFPYILLNRARSSDFDRNRSISHTVSKEIEANLCFAIFGENFRKSPKMAAICGDFRTFCQKLQNTDFLLSP